MSIKWISTLYLVSQIGLTTHTCVIVFQLLNCQPDSILLLKGWEVTHNATLPGLYISRQEVCTLHDSVVDNPSCRKIERTCRNLCIEFVNLAWHENRQYKPPNQPTGCWLTCALDRPVDFPSSVSRSILCSPSGCTQSRTTARSNEANQGLCEIVLL